MIRDLGNCGNNEKLQRIIKAWNSAKENHCGVVIVLDELCYGKSGISRFSPQEVYDLEIAGNEHELYLIHDKEIVCRLPWWDITKVNVLW